MPLVWLEVELDDVVGSIFSIRNRIPIVMDLNVSGESQIDEHVGLSANALELRVGQGEVQLKLQAAAAVAPGVADRGDLWW